VGAELLGGGGGGPEAGGEQFGKAGMHAAEGLERER
jgi:hypothetical protein